MERECSKNEISSEFLHCRKVHSTKLYVVKVLHNVGVMKNRKFNQVVCHLSSWKWEKSLNKICVWVLIWLSPHKNNNQTTKKPHYILRMNHRHGYFHYAQLKHDQPKKKSQITKFRNIFVKLWLWLWYVCTLPFIKLTVQ